MSEPVYTRAGDGGETSLADGARVSKASERVEAYGEIDEANAAVGLLRSSLHAIVDEEALLDRIFDVVQHRLMDCAANVATPAGSNSASTPALAEEDVAHLESSIDELATRLGESEAGFVLPTGCEEAARAHVARTIVRRAERRLVALAGNEEVAPLVLAYLNRLSDLLFVAARYANAVYGAGDRHWGPSR